MLRKVWGSSHDHKEVARNCYLCQGVTMWFKLATKLLEEYARLVHREGSAGGCGVACVEGLSFLYAVLGFKLAAVKSSLE